MQLYRPAVRPLKGNPRGRRSTSQRILGACIVLCGIVTAFLCSYYAISAAIGMLPTMREVRERAGPNESILLRKRRIELRTEGHEVDPRVPAAPYTGPRHKLGLCVSVKNEGRFLREWIEWHLMLGVGHFFIYDDGSTDDSIAIVKEYAEKGQATFVGGPEVWQVPNEKKHKIKDLLVHCFEYAAPHLDWMSFLDPDEFMFPIDHFDADSTTCSIASFLDKRCPSDQSHVMMRWQMFGTNGHDRHPAGSLPETHFWSGGPCDRASLNGTSHGGCGNEKVPYTAGACGECRLFKHIVNTRQCLHDATFGDSEHAEHWPVHIRSTDPMYTVVTEERGCRRGWVNDDPLESDLDSPMGCIMATLNTEEDFPLDLVDQHSLMRPRPHHRYSPKCCSGGIALYHYAVKSKEAIEWRHDRGFRHIDHSAPNRVRFRDLNTRFTPHALRFLRAFQRRLGPELSSPKLSFYDVRNSMAGDNVACSLHQGLKLNGGEVVNAARKALAVPNPDGTGPEQCCETCSMTRNCEAFTWSADAGCLLLKEGKGTPGKPPFLGYEHVEQYTAGVIVVNECDLGG
uniref:Glycosyltransferase family 92 protein n=2 Tax=Phaeomonas parva TaxID=124430 RepID=A0A7S1U546_9STRA|mmetsp:Transcript_31867/g.101443  ORF Transcript_31867/g.101443 Transcript_31867/m.101443 type:complete len:569 (+) Transcript_31867:227-1933(+)